MKKKQKKQTPSDKELLLKVKEQSLIATQKALRTLEAYQAGEITLLQAKQSCQLIGKMNSSSTNIIRACIITELIDNPQTLLEG